MLGANANGNIWRKSGQRWRLGEPAAASASVYVSETTSNGDDASKSTREWLSLETTKFERHSDLRELHSASDWLWSKANQWLPATWTGQQQTFEGAAEFQDQERERVLIIRDGPVVVAVPWSAQNYPEKVHLVAGTKCSVTVRHDDFVDADMSIAFVTDRVHDSRGAWVVDSDFYRLVRIKDGAQVLYDEAVCEVHHIRMELKKAEVSYGMYGPPTKADAFCDTAFPHHHDWIRGGCVEGDIHSADHYVCPACVAATETYKREHPQDAIAAEFSN